MKDKRFIEVSFPVKEVSEISAREKKHKTRAYLNTAYLVGSQTSGIIKSNELCSSYSRNGRCGGAV